MCSSSLSLLPCMECQPHPKQQYCANGIRALYGFKYFLTFHGLWKIFQPHYDDLQMRRCGFMAERELELTNELKATKENIFTFERRN